LVVVAVLGVAAFRRLRRGRGAPQGAVVGA